MSKKYSIKALAGILAASLTLSACSLFENDNRFEPTDLTDYQFEAQGHEIWKVSIGSGGSPAFAPTVLGQHIYAATPSGDVADVDLPTGKINWTVDLDTDLVGGAASDGKVVAVTSRDGNVIALDASSGEQLWTTRASSSSSAPAVITDKYVIVRADDYRIEAFDKQTGELQWNFQRAIAPMALRGNTRMVLAGNTLLAPVPIGRLIALNVDNGQLIWDLGVASVQGMTDLDMVVDVVGKPVVANNSLCINSFQSNTSCYTLNGEETPEKLWSKNFDSSVGLESSGSVLYGSSVHGEVTAFSGQNGDIQWQDSTLYNRGLTNPVLYKNLLYVGDYEGYIHFYDPTSGKLLGRMEGPDSDPIQSELIATDLGVLVQSGDGSLELLDAAAQ